jgi:hypothetical protein
VSDSNPISYVQVREKRRSSSGILRSLTSGDLSDESEDTDEDMNGPNQFKNFSEIQSGVTTDFDELDFNEIRVV